MLNRYPLWKYLLILGILILGVVYSLPNFYPDDPAVQISGDTASVVIDESVIKRATDELDNRGVPYLSAEVVERNGLVRFKDSESQLRGQAVLSSALKEGYVVALNLASTVPEWLQRLGAGPMKLGLDLRGGVHFLLEVDMAKVLEKRFESYVADVRDTLRKADIRYKGAKSQPGNQIQVLFENEELRGKGVGELRRTFREFEYENVIVGDRFGIKMTLTLSKLREIQDYAISQNITTIRNRVNELGVAEPVVQRQGASRIAVQLPGVQDTSIAKRVIGRTATLEFRMEDWEHPAPNSMSARVPSGSELYPYRNNERPPVLVKKRKIVAGESVIDAQANFDENNRPQVNITLDGRGGKKMQRVTSKHVGDAMAVLFIETKSNLVEKMVNGEPVRELETQEERYIINVATIQSVLSARFRITGLDSVLEASELALLLRAGALAAPMYYVEERTVGPSLGQQNIEAGRTSVILGFLGVLLFMVIWYRIFGLIANTALLVNVLLLVGVMSLIPGATLTLPGIAGIVLTVGMAVDANVLIFARIKEELRNGLSPQAAISAGYDRAFVTIMDANLTTLLVALVLFVAGTGPVKGFAVTLSIGIVTSMFTAIMGTRALVNLIYGGRQIKTLRI